MVWRKEKGKELSQGFNRLAAELQEIGNIFTAQGRADAAAGEMPRFPVVYFMVFAADPPEDSPLSHLMRLCYEEGYNRQQEGLTR